MSLTMQIKKVGFRTGMRVYIKPIRIHYIHMYIQYPNVSKGLERPRD